MKNVFKSLFAFLFIAVSVSSCDVGDDKELNYGNGSYVAQFPFASKTAFFAKDDAVVYDYTMPVEMVGGNGLALSSDVTVNFELDLVNSTAVEGLNFDFVGSQSLTIPANSTFATIPMKIYSGTLDDQNPPVIVLKLTSVMGSDKVVTSGNKGSVAITLQGTCTSDLGGTYNVVTTRMSTGATYTVAGELITETGDATYETSTTGNFKITTTTQVVTGAWNTNPGNRGGFEFTEVCGRVAVPEQNLHDTYSNLVLQDAASAPLSIVDSATGVITIYYTITFASGNRLYRSVYTPI